MGNTDTSTMKPAGFMERMYNGEGGFQIVETRRRWYWIYALVALACLVIIAVKGFTLGIDFEGGTKMSMPPSNGATEISVAETFEEATGVAPQSTQTVGAGDSRIIEITVERLSDDQIREARVALFDEFAPVDNSGTPSPDAISDSTVSESWGQSVTQRMLLGMLVFLAVVFIYITIRLDRDMAISAIVSLLLDGVVVAGVYSLVGFEVSPATVIGLLTILAYSLYDTVIVFDKVHENTQDVLSSTRSTYGEQVNLAVNQTIMRSLNTSLFSVIPIAALLVVAVWLMGVGTLKDLALVQLAGVIAGTISSIYFSAPLLVTFKGYQRRYREHDERVARARELAVAGNPDLASVGVVDTENTAGTVGTGNKENVAGTGSVTSTGQQGSAPTAGSGQSPDSANSGLRVPPAKGRPGDSDASDAVGQAGESDLRDEPGQSSGAGSLDTIHERDDMPPSRRRTVSRPGRPAQDIDRERGRSWRPGM